MPSTISTVVILVVLGLSIGGLLWISLGSAPTANSNITVSPILSSSATKGNILAKPTGPRTGAASLDLDTCGCPSHPNGSPMCANQRRWSIEKSWNNVTDAFDVTVHTQMHTVLEGEYELVITNSGDPTTTLQSIYLGLEMPNAGAGDAPGPSGQNFKRIAQTTISQSNICNVNQEAWICDETVGYHTFNSPDSELLIYDMWGNPIGDLSLVVIPTTSEIYGEAIDGIIDSGFDGPNCPYQGTLGVDDDGDGLIDEDGFCRNAVRIIIHYRFDLTGAGINATTMLGNHFRLNALTTFLAYGPRGGTCSTDTDCNGAISTDEQNARTVQQRYSFVFPSACVDQCSCVNLHDEISQHYHRGNGSMINFTIDPEVIDDIICMLPSNGTMSFHYSQYIDDECPDPNYGDSYDTLEDRATLSPYGPALCVDSFNDTLIDPYAATASSREFYCPPVYPVPPPSPTPSPSPSPSTPPGPHPPPAGAICSYTGGIFASNQVCTENDLANRTDVCAERRDSVKPACLVDYCVDVDGDGMIRVGELNGTAGKVSAMLINANLTILSDMMRQFIVDQLVAPAEPYYFINSYVFFTLLPPNSTTTSARQFARQLAVADFNIAMILYKDNATIVDLYQQLYYSNSSSCNDTEGVVVPAANGYTVDAVHSLATCAISLGPAYSNATFWSSVASACAEGCPNTPANVCESFFNTYTYASNFTSGGKTIWAVLSKLMDLFNNEYDACKPAKTGCILIP